MKRSVIKNICVLMLFMGYCAVTLAQNDNRDYLYMNYSVDANKAFDLKDNPYTIEDNRGIDWDLELGMRFKKSNIYAFYGRFDSTTTPSRFYNYGVGYDYIPNWFRWIDMSLGIAFSPMFKKDANGHWEGIGWLSARAVTTIWFHRNSPIGLSLRANLINASDHEKGYRAEGSIGIVLRTWFMSIKNQKR